MIASFKDIVDNSTIARHKGLSILMGTSKSDGIFLPAAFTMYGCFSYGRTTFKSLITV